MNIQPQFPPHRRQDPKRNSEAVVYDQLAQCGLPGHAIYELKATPEAPELDFFAWFEDRARIGGQVKGGPYSVDGTVWTLHTAHGPEHVPCPLTQTWDAAIVVRDAVNRVLGFKVSSSRCSSSPIPLRTVSSRSEPGSAGSRCSSGPKTRWTAGWSWLTVWRSNILPPPITSGMKWRP